MNINVKYFGQIAEAIKKDKESFEVDNTMTCESFVEFISAIYPQLQGYVYNVAVNQELKNKNASLAENDELALLPPFAGG